MNFEFSIQNNSILINFLFIIKWLTFLLFSLTTEVL